MTIEQFQETYQIHVEKLDTLAETAQSVPDLETVAAQYLNARALLERHLQSFGIQWES